MSLPLSHIFFLHFLSKQALAFFFFRSLPQPPIYLVKSSFPAWQNPPFPTELYCRDHSLICSSTVLHLPCVPYPDFCLPPWMVALWRDTPWRFTPPCVCASRSRSGQCIAGAITSSSWHWQGEGSWLLQSAGLSLLGAFTMLVRELICSKSGVSKAAVERQDPCQLLGTDGQRKAPLAKP